MRLHTTRLAAVAATFAVAAGGTAAQAASVEIKDAVARVTLVPEDRSDIKVEIARANDRLPLQVRSLGGRTIVDGDRKGGRRIRNCRSAGDGSSVVLRDQGRVDWADFPQVIIHTPRDVKVNADGAVFGVVGRSASLELGNAGCGDWTVANVQGAAKISQAGSGDTRMGSAGALKVSVAGSGDLAAGDIRGGLDVNIAGSGSASVRSVNGPLSVDIAGSGDVVVAGGRATEMKVSVAGSGDVAFKGVADTLRARIAGSGDVQAAAVRGEVSKMVLGSGSVRVGN